MGRICVCPGPGGESCEPHSDRSSTNNWHLHPADALSLLCGWCVSCCDLLFYIIMPGTDQYWYNLLLVAIKKLVWFSALLRETQIVQVAVRGRKLLFVGSHFVSRFELDLASSTLLWPVGQSPHSTVRKHVRIRILIVKQMSHILNNL